jgi:hypothetical protein
VNVFSTTAGSFPRLAKLCGAPGGTITSVRAGASNHLSPLVNRTVPDTT